MATRLATRSAFSLLLAVVTLTLGCDDSVMDKDLKRQADRATITLDRTKAELLAAQAENEALKKQLATARQSASSGSASSSELQAQLAAKDTLLRQAQRRVVELEQAAAARQGMPATRSTAP